MERMRLATVWLGGCSGCHMSFLDLDEWLIDLAAMADVVFTPFMDTKEYPHNVDACLVEGAIANEDHLEMIHRVRERTKLIVSFGDCAVTGNVTSLRNPLGRALPVLERSYVELADITPQIPNEPGIVPRLLDLVRPSPPDSSGRCVYARLSAAGRSHSQDSGSADRRKKARIARTRHPLWLGRHGAEGRPMSERIVIDPVTRIEGHAKITIQLGDDGRPIDDSVPRHGVSRLRTNVRRATFVGDACDHCPRLRHLSRQPFARLGQGGRPDPGSQDPSSGRKAPPPRQLAQVLQSHSLSFFHLSSPDLLLGLDSDPAKRNIFGVIAANPELARGGIRLAPVRPANHLITGRAIDPSRLGGAGWSSTRIAGRRHEMDSRSPSGSTANNDRRDRPIQRALGQVPRRIRSVW